MDTDTEVPRLKQLSYSPSDLFCLSFCFELAVGLTCSEAIFSILNHRVMVKQNIQNMQVGIVLLNYVYLCLKDASQEKNKIANLNFSQHNAAFYFYLVYIIFMQ